MSHYQHRRGQINDNALAALVHDPLFHQRIEKNRKGKGSYQRKAKHSAREGWQNTRARYPALLRFPFPLVPA